MRKVEFKNLKFKKLSFKKKNPEPPFPVVPNTFSTKLEAIIADLSETVSGEEYFDENNNRAALFMLRGGARLVNSSLITIQRNSSTCFVSIIYIGAVKHANDAQRCTERLN